MEHLSFHTPSWYHAMTLTERLALLRTEHRLPIEVNAALAEQRMKRWRSQSPFTRGPFFAQRLALHGMSEEEFLSLLGTPIEAIRDHVLTPPAWLIELPQAFSYPTLNLLSPLLEALRGEKRVGLLDAIEPLLSQGCKHLQEGVRALTRTYSDPPFNPDLIETVLFANLPEQLCMMLSPTMVLELNVARLQGILPGDTPEERFQSFIERICQRETALALLQEYPVLARQLMIRIHNWVASSLEFLQHLCADWEALRKMFHPEDDPGLLIQVEGGMGDYHKGGRSVLIAKFSSGFQVVYKPRSMAIDVHFQELLTWLNDQGDCLPFQKLKILDRGTYGWVEFVAAFGCTSTEEVRHFYERQGGYLALLYTLEATDFHFENLIAAGEHPLLVDLEALFHPRTAKIDIRQPYRLALDTMAASVLRVGLLPQQSWANAESDGVDLSGLGGAAGQLTPYGVPQWEKAGTDEMRLTRKQEAMAGGQNRPTLNGTEVNVLDYTEAIVTGFIKIYRLLLKHRSELLSDSSPVARFAEDEVRVIVRSTQIYASLLQESFHPDMLRNALDRDRWFDRLWVSAEYRPHLVKVLPAELDDLQQGDIPIFTTRPSSRHLWSSSGQQIAIFFDASGLALVQRRIQQLSEADLAQQLWFIRASLTSLAMAEERAPWPCYPLTTPQTGADHKRLLAAARTVGDRLEGLALRDEHDIAWIGLTQIGQHRWSLIPLAIDLYDGLSGVALFLAYLGMMTQENRYTTLARTVLMTLRREMEYSQSFLTAIGAFNGWSGLIYVLTHLSVLWDEPALLVESEKLVERLPMFIERDEHLDISNGTAGCIGSLLSLYHCAPSEQILEVAIQCGDHLIARAQPLEQGIGWDTRIPAVKPLTGFSHGAAGIAWALLELAAVTGKERFRTAACAAIAYERSLFSPEAGNWPDLRELKTSRQAEDNGQQRFMTTWCHGAPGIGLARLCSLQHLDDAAIRAEIETALQTTLAQGFGSNHSLCHGDLGNLELLLQASQVLEEPQWHAQVDRIAAIILESISRDGWLCGTPLGVESPGLMTGLAGIGYGLLRLAEPTRVPSCWYWRLQHYRSSSG